MIIPIEWNSEAGMWIVKNPRSGAVLWRGAKYSDAAQFAEDYKAQQLAAARIIAQTLATRG